MHVDRAFVSVAGQLQISNVPWLSISHNTHLSGYSSTRAEEGRHSDAEDDELCAVTSTAARDTHGHHAHAYRQGHEDYEMEDSACELTRHVDCMMSDLSIQSVTDLPFDVLDFEESLWDLSSVEDDDFELEVHGELNEVLRAFVLDKRSIVLDSACPELAPHIVITPPTDPWEGCVAYSWNTPQPQDDTYLTIPQRYCVPAYSASYALMEYYAQPSAMHASLIYRPALRLSRFMISSSEDEDDLSGSYRRLYKMATRIAMLMAPEFRARWDVEGFRRNQEKPFVWSDPAIPLLSFYGSCRDTRIIDSVHPFTSPHIVIHEAPDQTPWDACSNRIITPQHCENLMVPGVPCHCPVRVVSTPPLAEAESDSDMEGSVSSPTDESDSEFEPDTPAELGVFRFVVSYDCDPPLSCRSKVVRDFALDEDEDDLPPFDEWYQDIALRMR
ncbi:hypothetical protein BC835DRAFT_1326001 [Cytidiella melzeri]|nr:hypothetical protein BC835DRAFT_1326001 [Cytidiella melzeri]